MTEQADKICPICHSTYDNSLSFCVKDGQPLINVEPLIGQILDERYRIECVLGRGGMGVVYKATHIHIDTEYAVKILNPELVANQSAIERFRIEAKAAGRIRHPNAVQVTDFGITVDRVVYLVMELIDGQSLRKLLDEAGSFDIHRTRNILGQACAAVEAAHQRGVIHRDLKPDNIFIIKTGNAEIVKVLDFGIAKLKETSSLTRPQAPLTQAGTIIGTPEYMSPEQCRGEQLDPRSDVYSLGVILYEVLCGQLPFTASSNIGMVFKHLGERARPLREISPAIPAPVERVVLRAIEKDRDQRQASAAELSAEFYAAVNAAEGGVSSPTEPSSETAPPDKSTGVSKPRETVQESQKGLLKSPTEEGRSADSSQSEAVKVTPAEMTPGPVKSRQPIIAIAAVLLILLIGVGAYRVFKPSPRTAPVPDKTGSGPPPPGMILLPGGKFTMGRNDGAEDEGPAHTVEIRPFYIDKYEVTNEAYKKFVEATGHPAPRHWGNGAYPAGDAQLPVTHVAWQDAADYAKWMTKRLPKEEEWEYVARGGDKEYLYPWGNEWRDGYANVYRRDRDRPSTAQSFRNDRSPLGEVYDLAGNVSEWVDDFYRNRYDAPPAERFKVIRGGNFWDRPKTNTFRNYDYPNIPEDGDERTKFIERTLPKVGFRCAKDADR